jgi:hypothetical protein
MNKTDVMKSIKARLKYLETVRGFPAAKVTSVKDLVDTFATDADEIIQFSDCSPESYDELQMLVVEMCANLIHMSGVFDKPVTLFEAMNRFEQIPRVMQDPMDQKFGPSYINGGVVGKNIYTKGNPFEAFGEALKRVGRVSDGSLKNNETSKLSLQQKRLINDVGRNDPACVNGLTRIIVEFERPDLVEFMRNVGIKGRPMTLGFLAKLCKYDVARMDSVKNAYESRMITEYDITTECLENKGKRFNMEYIVDNYGSD